MNEFQVYNSVIAELVALRFLILCASPPGGTDLRFHRCMLQGLKRSGRDEVDVIGVRGAVALLIECKDTFSRAATSKNREGETDAEKLSRIGPQLSGAALVENFSHLRQVADLSLVRYFEPIVVVGSGATGASLGDVRVVEPYQLTALLTELLSLYNEE